MVIAPCQQLGLLGRVDIWIRGPQRINRYESGCPRAIENDELTPTALVPGQVGPEIPEIP